MAKNYVRKDRYRPSSAGHLLNRFNAKVMHDSQAQGDASCYRLIPYHREELKPCRGETP